MKPFYHLSEGQKIASLGVLPASWAGSLMDEQEDAVPSVAGAKVLLA